MRAILFSLITFFSANSIAAVSWKDYMPMRRMTIAQNGMFPTLAKGSSFFVKSGFLYSADDIERGSIITFYKNSDNINYIYAWRVIGIPGDAVITDGNDVYLNGSQLKRAADSSDASGSIFYEYIGEMSYRISLKSGSSKHQRIEVLVPAGFLFVMGDNRNNASDSRFIGLVPIEAVFGIKFP